MTTVTDMYRRLEAAGLHDLIPCRWCCEGHDGCETAWMLHVVCSPEAGADRVDQDTAVALLRAGFAPYNTTPWPDAAAALLARRGVGAD